MTATPSTPPLSLDERRHHAQNLPQIFAQLDLCTTCHQIREDCAGHGSEPTDQQDELESEPLFADVKAWRDGGGVAVQPSLMRRVDNAHLFYRGKVNKLVGDPESAKTWVALAACALDLRGKGRVLYIDADHNGVDGIVPRLDILGAPEAAINNPDRFRYAEVEDADQYRRVLAAALGWKPTVTVIDSHAAIADIHNLNDNDSGEMRRFARLHLNPFARDGGAVILIDHMAKNEVSRSHGESGSTAKGAAVSGVSCRVTVDDSWSIPTGGSTKLHIIKDRPGGVRAHCAPVKGREKPYVGVFRLHPPEAGRTSQAWAVYPPGLDGATPDEADLVGRIAHLPESDRSTITAVQEALKVRRAEATTALRKYRELST